MGTLKIGTVLQYVVIAVLGYIFAGAPLASMIFGSGKGKEAGEQRQAFDGDKSGSLVVPDPELFCEEHGYEAMILESEPLVVYVKGFLSAEEREHLVKLSNPIFTPSTIWTNGAETLDPSVRRSEKALLPRDHIVQCVEDRARRFQGWRPNLFIEKMWTQRYGPGGHYQHHYDWSAPIAGSRSGRVSSFMVYVEANCTGGGTNFPRLEKPKGEEWCKVVECDGEESGDRERLEGVTFKPIAGNAVFWENFRKDGSPVVESWHAGLPVKEGVKVGLNIWSWMKGED